jgi:hypothetical protein
MKNLEAEIKVNMDLEAEIERKKEEAKTKAITNLGRYKFMNFGYWAAVWVHLNQLSGKKDPSPFRDFVDHARYLQKPTNQQEGEDE